MSDTDPHAMADTEARRSEGEARRSEGEANANADVVTKVGARSVAETASLFTEMLVDKGMKIFDAIDQSAEARLVGLHLRETILVVFGSPAGGTPVMDAAPLSALDLPLKVLIWSDEGQTKVSYVSPDALATRHHLSPELVANLRGVEALTDALVAR